MIYKRFVIGVYKMESFICFCVEIGKLNKSKSIKN